MKSRIASVQPSAATVHWTVAFYLFKSLIYFANKKATLRVAFLLAEMEGFEPPRVLRRLADFESAPFSRLGTSP